MSGCFGKIKQFVFWFAAGVACFFVISLAVPEKQPSPVNTQFKHTTDWIHKQLAVAVSRPVQPTSTPIPHDCE